MQQPNRLNDEKKYSLIVERMSKRGVELHEIAEITYELQPKYLPNITREICLDHVKRVVMKREVQNAVLTGIELDLLAEEGKLSEPLSTLLMSDYGLYGIDEILALSIVNVYGSFAAAAASSVTYRYAETDKVIDAYEK